VSQNEVVVWGNHHVDHVPWLPVGLQVLFVLRGQKNKISIKCLACIILKKIQS
jgi:hypothetical protein